MWVPLLLGYLRAWDITSLADCGYPEGQLRQSTSHSSRISKKTSVGGPAAVGVLFETYNGAPSEEHSNCGVGPFALDARGMLSITQWSRAGFHEPASS